MIKHLRQIAFIFLVAMSNLGVCAATLHNADMVGIYVVDYDYGREELKLLSDGTYEQRSTPKNDSLKPAAALGKWYFDGESIRLFNSLVVDDFYGGLSTTYSEKKHGINFLEVQSHFGKTTLKLNANTEETYVEQ